MNNPTLNTGTVVNLVGTFEEIADQSALLNLSSLLAALNDDRPWDGYGVVDQELHDLAAQSLQATRRIGAMVSTLR